MAQCENHTKKIVEAIEKASYWFHDIDVPMKPNEHSVIKRKIAPIVQIIVIFIVLIMAQLIFPNQLRSLIDLIPHIVKGIISIENLKQVNKELL
jgi:hypothetical protein